jgi:shikimate dehydrogenase
VVSLVLPGAARCLVGLVGAGIGTSLSPPLHEQEAADLGLRYFYQLIDIDDLGLSVGDVGSLLVAARQLGFRGLNITHPCKQVVVSHLDELSPAAAALDAVNTVVFHGGKMIGHNTDSSGFEAAFTRGLPGAATGHVVVLGAGGAGAAVAHAIMRLGAERMTVVDLLPGRARQLAAALRAHFSPEWVRAADPGDLAAALGGANGLVNASPVGMEPRAGLPVPESLLRPPMWVADIVYRPRTTELLRAAQARGCRTLPGTGMLVFQAADGFRLFTGQAPDIGRMFRHLESLIGDDDVPASRRTITGLPAGAEGDSDRIAERHLGGETGRGGPGRLRWRRGFRE